MFTGEKKIWLIALFTVVLIALVNLAWWVYYDRTEKLMDHQLGRRLTAVANSAAVALRSESVENLILDDMTAFAEISRTLENIRRADSLAELFIVDQSYRLLATTSLEPDSVYFLAELNGQYIDTIFISSLESAVATPSYRSGTVFLKSAFAPLYGSDGFIAAVLGVEANVDYSDALTDLRSNLYYSTLLSIVGGLIFGIIFLFLQRRIGHAERQLFLNQTHSFLGRMVAVVSHEIKNPLMIMRASAERLRKKSEDDESRFIVEEVDRLDQIVTGYLDFAGAKGNLIEHDSLERVNLLEIISNIKRHFQSKYPEHEIEWLDRPAPGEVTIETYPRSLRQVILNLLINGADACLAASKPIAIGVNAEEKGHTAVVRVIDHGPGLSRKEIKKIFTPFYTTSQSGSGLGLYLSKKIIEDMGGSLDIDSRKGYRTELIIALPKTPKK